MAGARVILASAAGRPTRSSAAHLSVSGSKSSSPVAPGSASPNGSCLRVVVDGRVIGAHEVDRAVGEPGAQRRAIARAAQRRDQPALRVEPADVDVAEMQVVDADVAGHRQPSRLAARTIATPSAGRQPAQVNAARR